MKTTFLTSYLHVLLLIHGSRGTGPPKYVSFEHYNKVILEVGRVGTDYKTHTYSFPFTFSRHVGQELLSS